MAEKVIAFTLKNLCDQGIEIGRDLKNRFKAAMLNLSIFSSYLDQPQDQFGHKAKQSNTAALATIIFQRLFLHYDGNEDNPEDIKVDGAMDITDQEKPMTLAQELHTSVEDTKNTDLSAHVIQI